MALSSDPLSPSSIASSTSSTGKRPRRTTRKNEGCIPSPSSSTLEEDDEQPQHQQRLKLHGGDAVEAVKLTDDAAKQWFCARVVDTDGPLVLVHYEGFPADHADWISQTLVRPRRKGQQRALLYGPRGKEDWRDFVQPVSRTTGLVHDRRMGLHTCPCTTISHPERPERITSIFDALYHHR
ncbi:hypothetical protein BDB00DRAFT_851515 [Zychaea mexicana]|uniref:uncharacterized protein n=1 Tax=Zychaea mexicana TaxID=64656 RepID=UPI0022FEE274|nr:uncharacterized protein BDB00DRAFT_851515 [Zychaea mexicana]KAI9485104.1 hypothetical protein BDB00DRAFT_851515 [Zychaea mexicana]